MGMLGSETALEELMSRVLGDMIQAGCVAKIADDLYVGSEGTNDLAFKGVGGGVKSYLSFFLHFYICYRAIFSCFKKYSFVH